jgi:hypothetical protein
MDERDREVAVLERIRSRFAATAASCNERAKAIVAATTAMIAERRGRRRERADGDGRRPSGQ